MYKHKSNIRPHPRCIRQQQTILFVLNTNILSFSLRHFSLNFLLKQRSRRLLTFFHPPHIPASFPIVKRRAHPSLSFSTYVVHAHTGPAPLTFTSEPRHNTTITSQSLVRKCERSADDPARAQATPTPLHGHWPADMKVWREQTSSGARQHTSMILKDGEICSDSRAQEPRGARGSTLAWWREDCGRLCAVDRAGWGGGGRGEGSGYRWAWVKVSLTHLPSSYQLLDSADLFFMMLFMYVCFSYVCFLSYILTYKKKIKKIK